MKPEPLISVITPCYDDAHSLPMALASLVAQTHANWECVVVDDGSFDDVKTVVEAFDDPRIRLVRLPRNQGRPVARQVGLNKARGDFIAFLDADDWYYPTKLASQLTVFAAYEAIALVSGSMAIVDEAGELTGVRRFTVGDEVELKRLEGFRTLYFSSAGALVRAELAKKVSFDVRLTRSEDRDYLIRLLEGQVFAISPEIHYVYREFHSTEAMEEALEALRCQRLIYRKYFASEPIAAWRAFVEAMVRSAVYGAAGLVGAGKRLFDRRNTAVTASQREAFDEAQKIVRQFIAPSLRGSRR
jgi:glycosyltransferase involved in cell wall biosynthesis